MFLVDDHAQKFRPFVAQSRSERESSSTRHTLVEKVRFQHHASLTMLVGVSSSVSSSVSFLQDVDLSDMHPRSRALLEFAKSDALQAQRTRKKVRVPADLY